MKAAAMLQALEDAATRLEVRVSYEPLAASVGNGGLCRVRGQYRVIIDKRATTEERVATLAQSLARVSASPGGPGPAAMGLPAAVRELVDFYVEKPSGAAVARPAVAVGTAPTRRAS